MRVGGPLNDAGVCTIHRELAERSLRGRYEVAERSLRAKGKGQHSQDAASSQGKLSGHSVRHSVQHVGTVNAGHIMMSSRSPYIFPPHDGSRFSLGTAAGPPPPCRVLHQLDSLTTGGSAYTLVTNLHCWSV